MSVVYTYGVLKSSSTSQIQILPPYLSTIFMSLPLNFTTTRLVLCHSITRLLLYYVVTSLVIFYCHILVQIR